MKFIPKLFSTPMVLPILDGRKKQTRRVINPQPSIKMGVGKWIKNSIIQMIGGQELVLGCMLKHSPYKIGDIIWVREKSCYVHLEHAHDLLVGFRERRQMIYGTDMHDDWMAYAKEKYGYKWKPSLFMPKDACRIFLKITDVRAERLQDISEEDAKAEGAVRGIYRQGPNVLKGQFQLEHNNHASYKDGFRFIWQSINGEQSWKDNPWVWVIEFERIELTEYQKQIFHSKK